MIDIAVMLAGREGWPRTRAPTRVFGPVSQGRSFSKRRGRCRSGETSWGALLVPKADSVSGPKGQKRQIPSDQVGLKSSRSKAGQAQRAAPRREGTGPGRPPWGPPLLSQPSAKLSVLSVPGCSPALLRGSSAQLTGHRPQWGRAAPGPSERALCPGAQGWVFLSGRPGPGCLPPSFESSEVGRGWPCDCPRGCCSLLDTPFPPNREGSRAGLAGLQDGHLTATSQLPGGSDSREEMRAGARSPLQHKPGRQ